MTRLTTRMLILGALIISALGVSAIGATAKTAPAKHKPKPVIIKSGTTTVTPTPKTLAFLTANGIAPKAIAPATIGAAGVQFPVSGGTVAKKNIEILHKGGLELTNVAKKVTVTLSKFTFVKTAKGAQLLAVIKSKTVALANVTGVTITKTKKSETVTGELHLTKASAALLNQLAGTKSVKAGFDFAKFKSVLKLA